MTCVCFKTQTSSRSAWFRVWRNIDKEDQTSQTVWGQPSKVKLSLYRPRQFPRDPGGWGTQDFQTVGKWGRQSCQPYAPTAFTPRRHPWYSFLLEARVRPDGWSPWDTWKTHPCTWLYSPANPPTSNVVARILRWPAHSYSSYISLSPSTSTFSSSSAAAPCCN